MERNGKPGDRPKRERRRPRPEFFDYWSWKLDQVPLGNDGRCPHCGHAHGPRFGRFFCDACGRKVGDSAAERGLVAKPWWRVTVVVGAVVLGVMVFAWLFDPTFPARLARLFRLGA